jgi:hypothetical protein
MLVMSRTGWRTEMAKWIGEARAAELEEDSDSEDDMELSGANRCTTKWKPITLVILFGSQKPPPSRLLPEEIDAESELMQALAEIEEDEQPDDGAVEINSDEEFRG